MSLLQIGSQFDEIFIDMCKRILKDGEYVPCRAKWADGTQSNTIHITNVVNEYDVGAEFPILTIRPTPIIGPLKEIFWIYQQKSNNINDLGMHIWDSWADASGSIGKAYGYQIAQKYVHHTLSEPSCGSEIMKTREWYPSYSENYVDNFSSRNVGKTEVLLDQMDAVLWDLRENDTSRRIMTGTYNFSDLHEMGLHPCAHSTTWNVFNGKLNLILNQRSQDVLAAAAFNVIEYAALLVMVAKATGHGVGKLTHVISDCHIYDRHIETVEELISRDKTEYPVISFNADHTNFYKYTKEDWELTNYNPQPQVKFEVAI